jgi:hypothetical protein
VFSKPVRADANVVYSQPGETGIYTNLKANLDGKVIKIRVSPDHIIVNGRTYRFARAIMQPGEPVADIYPDTANVFLASRMGNRPALLCVSGQSGGSGEADRYQQIFLLVNPLGGKPELIHLPALLSSCRAVLVVSGGQLAFPKNSYIVDEAQLTRIGLRVSYLTFGHGKFSPTGKEFHLRFESPENPFQFSLEDELIRKAP